MQKNGPLTLRWVAIELGLAVFMATTQRGLALVWSFLGARLSASSINVATASSTRARDPDLSFFEDSNT